MTLDHWVKEHPVAASAIATATALFIAALAYIWR